jgi:hypothetical protein
VATSDGVLLGWGGGELDEFGGSGLVGFDLRTGARWHLFGRRYIDVQVFGRYAYAIDSWDSWRVTTVDISSADVARHIGRPPTILPSGSSIQGW